MPKEKMPEELMIEARTLIEKACNLHQGSIAGDPDIDDLGIDSMDRVELAMAIEDATGGKIAEDKEFVWVCVSDVAHALRTTREAASVQGVAA